MKEVSNRTVVLLLIATIAISLGGTLISLSAINNRLTFLGLAPITGLAVVPNATVNLSVQTASSIRFISANIDFGSGSVNTAGGFTNCTLSTLDSANSGCTDFNEVSNGFTVENDGNTNLTVELRSNRTAAQFIDIGSALFLWNVTVNETDSCVNISGSARNVLEPNTTTSENCGGVAADNDCGAIFESVRTSNKVICPSLLYDNSKDALNIDINISIPSDAPVGAKLAGLIVTGTRNPTS